MGLLVFPLYFQYLYYDITENTESIKKKKKSKNIELPAAVKTIRNAVMFSPLIALGFLDVEPKGKKKEKQKTWLSLG